MPYEKSDNTTNVVRPTLTKIQQKKKDTPQHRKYVQKKVEQEELRRLSQDPYQAQISQGRNYSAAEQKRRETASQRRGEIEQMHHDDQLAAETMHMAFAPFLLSNWVGATTTNNGIRDKGRGIELIWSKDAPMLKNIYNSDFKWDLSDPNQFRKNGGLLLREKNI